MLFERLETTIPADDGAEPAPSPPSRKQAGAYYTPDAVVATLVRWAVRNPTDRLLDPSCGDGRFIALHRNSVGVEQDPAAADVARGRAPHATVHHADFFAWSASTRERFTCAAGNPPFIRYQTFKGETRRRALAVCAALGADFSGLASSWAPFLVAAAGLLAPGGRMAFVVPAEIGHAPYAAPLLEYLVRRFATVHVVAYREKLFPELSEDCWLLYADGFGAGTDEIRFTALEAFEPSSAPPRRFVRVPGRESLLEQLPPAPLSPLRHDHRLRKSTEAAKLAAEKPRRRSRVNAHAAPVRESLLAGTVTKLAKFPFDLSELPTDDNTPESLAALLAANRHYREAPWPAPFERTRHRLHLGDARNLSWIPDASVHLVVTSPPYWTLKRYRDHDQQLGAIADYEVFLDELDKVWRECARVLVGGGRICCVVGDVCIPRRQSGRHYVMPLHADIQVRARRVGLDCLTPVLWNKIANGVTEAEGNGAGFYGKPYQPGAVVKNDVEYVLFLRKGGAYRSPTPLQKALSMLTKEEMQAWWRSIWTDIRGASTRAGHPAPYPAELAERLIRMFSFAGDTVLDPFAGTGSTTVAAVSAGRNSIGNEIDPEYLRIAAIRVREAVSRPLLYGVAETASH